MRICYVYGGVHATDGGIGFLRNLCSHLRALGHACFTVLGESNGALMGSAVEREIHINGDWRCGGGESARYSRKQLRWTLDDLKPDVVHVIHPSTYYGGKAYIHALPVIWRDFPVIATFWGFNIGRGSTWLARLMVLLLLWGSKALASHDFKLMSDMRRLCLGRRQVHFLPVGSNILPSSTILQVSQQDLRRRYDLDLDGQYLGYFGGFDQSMGVTDLFQAVRQLREEGHDRLRLLLIGWQRHVQNPRFIAMQQAMEREQVLDIVTMTPFAPDDEVAALLRAVNLVVLPYRRNSMGRTSLMAALSAGAPVVLASSLADLGPFTGAVMQVPPQSPFILAKHISSALTDTTRVEALGRSGRQVWEKNFSWPVIAKKHLQLYQAILKP